MAMDRQNLTLYTVHVEGSILALRDREFVDTVVAQSTEGENENALVLVTPEQVAKLPELLRVREVAPAKDGIYVGRGGTWYAVLDGQVTQSGQWSVPQELLASFQMPSQTQSTTTSAAPGAEPRSTPTMVVPPVNAPGMGPPVLSSAATSAAGMGSPPTSQPTASPPTAAEPTPVASAAAFSSTMPTGSDERDPVCGMRIKPGMEAANVMYHGETYHFCSVECRDIFLQNPARAIEQGAGIR